MCIHLHSHQGRKGKWTCSLENHLSPHYPHPLLFTVILTHISNASSLHFYSSVASLRPSSSLYQNVWMYIIADHYISLSVFASLQKTHNTTSKVLVLNAAWCTLLNCLNCSSDILSSKIKSKPPCVVNMFLHDLYDIQRPTSTSLYLACNCLSVL